MPDFSRRQLFALPVLAAGGLAAAKVGGRWLLGAEGPSRPLPELTHLSPRQAAIVTAAALAMVGPAAEAAYEAGRWEPARDVDGLLGRLAADQRTTVGVGIHLLEEWTLGMRGFSSWDRATQRSTLTAWRTSGLALHRSVWGFLHAATCSSFSGSEAGWELAGYPGPLVGSSRPPGQSATLEWGEGVP